MIVLTLTAAGSASFLIIAAVSRIMGNRISHSLRYYLLIIPLILYLVPIAAGTVSVRRYENINSEAAPQEITPSAVSAETEETAEAPVANTEPIGEQIKDGESEARAKRRTYPIKPILEAVWITGAAAAAIAAAVKKRRFGKMLSRIAHDPDEARYNEFVRVCEKYGVKRIPDLKIIDDDITPFITGIIRPVIALPSETGGGTECVLRHELTHLKRRDLVYKQLVRIVALIHWFNPIIYFYCRYADKQMELSCDEAVIRGMSGDERISYSRSILTLMRGGRNMYAAALSEGAKNIKQRLEVIMMKSNKYSKITAVFTALAVAAASVTAAAAAGSVSSKSGTGIYKITDRAIVYLSNISTDYMGKGIGERNVIMINTPFYKSFYAEINADTYYKAYMTDSDGERIAYGGEGSYYSIGYDKDNPITADIEVRMDSFDRVIDSDWIGTFSVSFNGETIIDNVRGELENAANPSAGLSYLQLDDNYQFDMMYMNFGIDSDTVLQANYDEQQSELAIDESGERVYYSLDYIRADSEIMAPDAAVQSTDRGVLAYARNVGAVDFHVTCGDVSIDAVGEYTVTDDDISGSFLYVINDIPVEKFAGTISGYSGAAGESITLKSDDGRYEVAMTAEEKPENAYDIYDMYGRDWFGYIREFEDYNSDEYNIGRSRFAETAEIAVANRHALLEDFPFDIVMNDDKQSISLTLKDGVNYEGWYMNLSTYSNMYQWNLYENRYSTSGEDVITYPIYNDGRRHELSFTMYNTADAAEMYGGYLQFIVCNDEISYTQFSIYRIVNSSYKGADALERLSRYYYGVKEAASVWDQAQQPV